MVAELQDIETRKLASFRTVDDIQPIDGADAIELAVVGGWKVVTKKGEFKVGDPCVYFEIDSFLPDGVPAWQFLIDKQSRTMNGVTGHRLRTIKLRGQISQGLILPTRIHPATRLALCLDEEAFEVAAEACTPEQIEEAKYLRQGMDDHCLDPRDLNLNKLLGIVKWDPPLPAQLQGLAAGLFPSWIRKTDQERAQNLKAEIFGYEDQIEPFDVSEMTAESIQAMFERGLLLLEDGAEGGKAFKINRAKADRDARYEITMKMDGSSATYAFRDGELVVCSRNLQLKLEGNDGNTFVDMIKAGGLDVALTKLGMNVAVQGELMGPSIQKNREELKDFQLFIFTVQLLDEGRDMTPDEKNAFFEKLVEAGMNQKKVRLCPVIGYDVTLQELGLTDMDKLLAFAEGPSLKHVYREGLVYVKMDGTFSFKTISNSYLAKEKD